MHLRGIRRRLLAVAMLTLVSLASAGRAQSADVVVQPAVNGIIAAFGSHPLVGIGEHHALAQEGDFYVDLVRDPHFPDAVGNIVVEFGSALHQGTLDRYLAGEDVPYAELQGVWTDVVGWYPNAGATMYLNLFAHVRAVNQTLSPARRIKVWLADPGFDLTKAYSRAELQALQDGRDAFGANLIEREILSRGKKALVIYGYPHFQNFELRSTGIKRLETVWSLVEQRRPGSFFVVRAYVGLPDAACSARFEARIIAWPKGSLVGPLRNTWLEDALYPEGCHILPSVLRPPGGPEPVFSGEQLVSMNAAVRGAKIDALLYFGPEATLTTSPWDPASYMDHAYFNVLSRKSEILLGSPMNWSIWLRQQAHRPLPYTVK